MRSTQNLYRHGAWQQPVEPMPEAQLVFTFGDSEHMKNADIRAEIQAAYPKATIIGCSTSGEILGEDVYDKSLCLTGIEFESTQITVACEALEGRAMSDVIQSLVSNLDTNGLRHVLVLSDGQSVNGSELVSALDNLLPKEIIVTGGLAGDGTDFEETYVWYNDDVCTEQILLCGFYGDAIQIGHGCRGGWEPFGPKRVVTKSKGNVLYSLDDRPALELYKKYLGKYADELPSSALLFPLQLSEAGLTRTILNIDDRTNTMIFAGDVPTGSTVQLMRASSVNIIGGAETAAKRAVPESVNMNGNGVAILISCVGRRLVLKTRVEEELESVSDVCGGNWDITGFYSYGEISPLLKEKNSALHNQTMTITTLYERNE